MTTEHLQEQACLYAAGALPPEEAREVEAAMRHNPELRRLVEELREAAESIATGIPQSLPPARLKQNLFAQLDAAAPVGGVLAPEFRPPPKSALWIPLSLAACLAALCVVLVWTNRSAQQQTDALAQKFSIMQQNTQKLTEQAQASQAQAQQIPLLQQQLQSAAERMLTLSTQTLTLQGQAQQTDALRQDLENMKRRATELSTLSEALRAQIADLQSAQRVSLMQIALLKSLLPDFPESVGVSVWDKDHQKGIFVADKMPPLPEDQQYQLWILDPKYASPVSAGVFSVDGEGHARVEFAPSLPVDRSDRFAVSIERKGGATQPEGRIVLLTQ